VTADQQRFCSGPSQVADRGSNSDHGRLSLTQGDEAVPQQFFTFRYPRFLLWMKAVDGLHLWRDPDRYGDLVMLKGSFPEGNNNEQQFLE